MKIAGLDIGTTGCKLTVFDPDGKNLGHSYRDYPVKRGKSEHEVDAEAIMGSVMEVIRDMAGKYPDIAGISVTSFGETFVMADENGLRSTGRCSIPTRGERKSAVNCWRSWTESQSHPSQA